MAAIFRATIVLERNGVEIRRIVRRVSVDENQSFDYDKATGGGYASLPVGELATLQLLLLENIDQAVTVRLNGQSDAGILLTAGGLLLMLGGSLTDGAATNATVDNSSGSTTVLRGVAGGT